MKTKSLLHYTAFGLAVATMMCLTVQSSTAQTWNATDDFSLASNPNGAWTYQWLTGLVPDVYGSMTNSEVNFGGNAGLNAWDLGAGSIPVVVKNTDPTNTYYGWAPGVLGMHPGAGGNHAVVTWTAPTAGDYSFSSSFTWVGSAGNGVIPSVTRNAFNGAGGTSYGSQAIGPGQPSNAWSWDNGGTPLTLAAGETISWAVNPNIDFGGDSTVLTAVVTTIPEPTTFALLAGALVCGAVLVRSRRQRTSH